MNPGWIWCRKKAVVASGASERPVNAAKIALWMIFAANDSKPEKNH